MPDAIETNTGSISHKCSTCSRSFSSNSHLRRHESAHTRDRLNTCTFCNRTFVRHDVLRRHSKSCPKRGEHDEIASAKPGRRSRLRTTESHAQPLHEDTHATITSHLSRDTTAGVENAQSLPPCPITFLYQYTDPRRESILSAFIGDPLTVRSSKSQENYDADHQLFDRDVALFGIFSDFFVYSDVDISASIPPAPGRPQTTTLLQPRIDELCSQLFIYSQTCRTAHFNPEGAFPVVAAKAVFTAENIEECIWAYFTVFHPQQPLIHWPTFDMHKVSLPLLLAVAFGGSVHCTPTDGALSSRSFFHLAEDFIFEHLRDVVAKPNFGHDPRALEAVQAASLIVALQSTFNNEATRSRVEISRHPEIVAAMRSLKLLEPTVTVRSPNQVPEWNAFIAEESRVRAVHFIFAMDCMATFFFSSVPKIAIAEVSQTLPCNDVLYDAATAEDYTRLRTQSKRLARPKPSIKQLVSALMNEDWSDEQKGPLIDVLEHRLLMIGIFALHSIVFVSRATLLAPMVYTNLVRATKRWKELWDALHAKREAEEQRLLGFVKHGLEIWWVTCKYLELAHTGEVQSRYMALAPTDSLVHLHDFLKRYANCVERQCG